MENEKYFYLAYPLLLFHPQWMKYLQKTRRRWNGKKLIIEKNIVIMLVNTAPRNQIETSF